ncbi:flavoprotein [Nocardia blacklockiae]|uniref:flavoprotein n=1 Tax=Nocardia blacklockiae TaxID=480036 RepID=UPI002B4AFBC4|nr:flavoprotein [Nocardia blacklockiae]
MDELGRPVLYAIVTGSPAARDVGRLVDLARGDGWEVCVVASPDGRRFIDVEELESRTGHPVRSHYKDPGTPDVLPPADAMIAAPLSGNSLAKWAAGISDTLPLGLLVEAHGKGLPVVAVPFSNRAQLSFPALQDAMGKLAQWGITMLAGDDLPAAHEPGLGADRLASFPWELAWRAVLDHPLLPRELIEG